MSMLRINFETLKEGKNSFSYELSKIVKILIITYNYYDN